MDLTRAIDRYLKQVMRALHVTNSELSRKLDETDSKVQSISADIKSIKPELETLRTLVLTMREDRVWKKDNGKH